MKKSLVYLLTLAIGVGLFIIIMGMVGWQRVVDALLLFLSLKGLAILTLTFVAAWVSVFKWKFVLERLTDRPKFEDLGKAWFAGFAITYLLTPVAALGGEPFRIYFVKKRYSLDLKKSIASVGIERVFDWTLFLIFTIIGIFAFLFYAGLPAGKMGWLVMVLVGVLFSLLFFFYVKALRRESTLEWFLKPFGVKKNNRNNSKRSNLVFEVEEELMKFFSLKKKVFWQGIAWSFAKYFLFFLRVVLLIFFLGGGTNLFQGLAIYGVSNVAVLFPTPASLGSLEATGVFSFKTLGLGTGSGSIFAIVLRGAEIVVSLIGIVFLLKFAISLTGEKILNYIDKLKE